ncbi:hypothetical protein EVAR_61523_1 [Eumeta japonica]|uniref:CCHC-type domain-containing protein n=1 Tax=Eumeta variegata TaxID=151549 RepID=A0A4C1YVN5_EUMVA|nr:hypothetical protein EVAR_61523_1 [Eumeta japonica]
MQFKNHLKGYKKNLLARLRAAACSAPSMSHAASSRVTPRPALDTSSAVSPGVATARASDNGDTHPRALSNIRQLSKFSNKTYCVYCRKTGHNRDNCAQLKRKNVKSSSLSCYGCGTKGVIRANCDSCKQQKESFSSCDLAYNDSVSSSNVCKNDLSMNAMSNDFCLNDNVSYDPTSVQNFNENVISMNISALHCGGLTRSTSCAGASCDGRPILDIKVLGITGTGLIDTAAKRSIAGSSLHALLVKRGQKFRSSKMIVKLADGSVNNINVKLADVIVTLKHLNIPLTFIILPNSSNNETLLGIDFIRKAGLIINLSTNTWLTADRPHVIYPLRCETSVHTIECASTDVLRIDEGTMLSPPERDDLARLPQEYQDIFTQRGRTDAVCGTSH